MSDSGDGTDELDPCPGCDADPCACEPEEPQETCSACGELARRSGLSPAYVSRAASGKERVAGDLAAFLGFERVTVYRRLP